MNIDVRGRLEMAQLELSVNSDEIVALKVEVCCSFNSTLSLPSNEWGRE